MKALILLLLFSCSHSVHMVQMSDGYKKPRKSSKKITALAEQKVIFWFADNTNYVEEARDKLIAQCPKREIANIVTRYSTSHGFFSWTNKIFMQATCR